ncbi:MAG: hypothetical protein HCAMLNBO_00850 [Candidatus Brocadia fulgida]|nr:hypothetical protein [Candidatus Brocadia fulgida]
MGYNQQAPCVIQQGILEDLFGRDVDMVGWFIQDEKIRRFEQHLGKRQPRFFATAQDVHTLKDVVAGEKKGSQDMAGMGDHGKGGNRLDFLEYRIPGIQFFSVFLGKIIKEHVVPHPDRSGVRLLNTGDDTEEGRFP